MSFFLLLSGVLSLLSPFLVVQSLAQYGTDFSFISQMFPKRTRRQVKSKFKREEKENQYLVDAALRKKIPIGQNRTTGGQDALGCSKGALLLSCTVVLTASFAVPVFLPCRPR